MVAVLKFQKKSARGGYTAHKPIECTGKARPFNIDEV
jgi:hypothetical protein